MRDNLSQTIDPKEFFFDKNGRNVPSLESNLIAHCPSLQYFCWAGLSTAEVSWIWNKDDQIGPFERNNWRTFEDRWLIQLSFVNSQGSPRIRMQKIIFVTTWKMMEFSKSRFLNLFRNKDKMWVIKHFLWQIGMQNL